MRSLGSRLCSVQDEEVEQLQRHIGSVPYFFTSKTAQASAQAHSHTHTRTHTNTWPTLHLWLGQSLLMDIILIESLGSKYFYAWGKYWCLWYNDDIQYAHFCFILGSVEVQLLLHSPLNFACWFRDFKHCLLEEGSFYSVFWDAGIQNV